MFTRSRIADVPTTILSPNTIRDVDEYLQLDVRGETLRDNKPWTLSSSQGNIHPYNNKTIPKFAVDGYGRWKQIGGTTENTSINGEFFNGGKHNGNRLIEDLKGLSVSSLSSFNAPLNMEFDARGASRRSNHNNYNNMTSRNGNVNRVPSGGQLENKNVVNNMPININDDEVFSRSSTAPRSSVGGGSRGYNHLSMSIRSNVFPGMGQQVWQSSTKQSYVPKHLQPASDSEDDFTIKKDSFMKWSEYDVYRQRLMKAWDKYITDMPTKDYSATPSAKKEKMKQTHSPAKPSKKKAEKQPRKGGHKDQNKDSNSKEDTKKSQDSQPMRIEVKPAPSEEDGFWDFYEKPFEQS
eukprot:gene10754-11904_t